MTCDHALSIVKRGFFNVTIAERTAAQKHLFSCDACYQIASRNEDEKLSHMTRRQRRLHQYKINRRRWLDSLDPEAVR